VRHMHDGAGSARGAPCPDVLHASVSFHAGKRSSTERSLVPTLSTLAVLNCVPPVSLTLVRPSREADRDAGSLAALVSRARDARARARSMQRVRILYKKYNGVRASACRARGAACSGVPPPVLYMYLSTGTE
jgi:hypothetical protein